MLGVLPTKNFRSGMATLCGKIASLRSNQDGTSALEFSLFAGILIFSVLNVVDISIYLYQRMQVENATQMAVQAAWKTCDPSKGYLPATTSCPDLTTSITQAAQSTSLGDQIAIQNGSPSEGYYCLNSSGALQLVATATANPPADCSSTGFAGTAPADYINITTSFPYAPLFAGITVANTFTTPIVKTSTMRLN